MTKEDFILKVSNSNLAKDQKTNILNWFNSLPVPQENAQSKIKATQHKIGDVYMHTIFRHPYILLEELKDGTWLACLLTSEKNCKEILEPARSRFFSTNFITKTIFTVSEINDKFMAVYDNTQHLVSIRKKIKTIINN